MVAPGVGEVIREGGGAGDGNRHGGGGLWHAGTGLCFRLKHFIIHI